MFKRLKIRLLFRIALGGILLISCDKQNTYDLFPLEVGNEFYYSYYKKTSMITTHTKGVESWKVISESHQGDSIVYLIEKTLKATRIIPGIDTTDIFTTDQFEISQKKSTSLISFSGFEFMRYQDISRIELNHQGYSNMPTVNCVFKADSGMVKYYYHHPPNQICDITLQLDSIKISH